MQLARQELTRDWWDRQRYRFDLRTSQFVLDEAALGEAAKAAERLGLLDGIPLLDINPQVEALATRNSSPVRILPVVAGRDAFHLAAAGVHEMDFLLTWNCKHIANPFIADRLRTCFSGLGVHLPVICTPEQFFPDEDHDSRDDPRISIDPVIAGVRRAKVELHERFNYDLAAMARDTVTVRTTGAPGRYESDPRR